MSHSYSLHRGRTAARSTPLLTPAAPDLVIDDLTVQGRPRHVRKAKGHMVVVAMLSVLMSVVLVKVLRSASRTRRAEVVIFIVKPC